MTLAEMWQDRNGKSFYCRRPTWKCCQALVTRVDASGHAWGVRFIGKSGEVTGMGLMYAAEAKDWHYCEPPEKVRSVLEYALEMSQVLESPVVPVGATSPHPDG